MRVISSLQHAYHQYHEKKKRGKKTGRTPNTPMSFIFPKCPGSKVNSNTAPTNSTNTTGTDSNGSSHPSPLSLKMGSSVTKTWTVPPFCRTEVGSVDTATRQPAIPPSPPSSSRMPTNWPGTL